MILLSASLSGVANSSANFDIESQLNTNISSLGDTALYEIAGGNSGIYKGINDDYIIISNFNDSDPLTQNEIKIAESTMDSLTLERMNTSSFYSQSDSHDNVYLISSLNKHLQKGALDLFADNIKENISFIQGKADTFTVLHELAHYFTVKSLERELGEDVPTQTLEIAADTLGLALMMKTDDLSHEDSIRIIDEMIIVRDTMAINDGEFSHHTTFGLNLFKDQLMKDDSLVDKLKLMDNHDLINTFTDLTIIAHSSMNSLERNSPDANLKDEIKREYLSFIEKGKFDDNSKIKEHYDAIPSSVDDMESYHEMIQFMYTDDEINGEINTIYQEISSYQENIEKSTLDNASGDTIAQIDDLFAKIPAHEKASGYTLSY